MQWPMRSYMTLYAAQIRLCMQMGFLCSWARKTWICTLRTENPRCRNPHLPHGTNWASSLDDGHIPNVGGVVRGALLLLADGADPCIAGVDAVPAITIIDPIDGLHECVSLVR